MKNFLLWFISWGIHWVKKSFQRFKLCVIRLKRRKNNLHNETYIEKITDISKISVWKYTYGPISAQFWCFEWFIKIGSYCAIASNVELLCGADHTTQYLSQLWFDGIYNPYIYSKFINPELKCIRDLPVNKIKEIKNNIIKNHKILKSKWPIIIDDDVRIWTRSIIMSGVHIWQGAVIAAWSVVTKDIPPYAIVWWVPAKIISYRFSEDNIKKLMKINFSSIPLNKFLSIYEETIKTDFNIDKILKEIWIKY